MAEVRKPNTRATSEIAKSSATLESNKKPRRTPRKSLAFFLRTHLISRERVRCWRFGAAARREEEEYPLWICDRRATPLRRQRSATLSGYTLVDAWLRCSSVTERIGYASSSRLASRPPELSALIPYI